MALLKRAHYDQNFALFDKTGLDLDRRLSWAAKGILSYVLSKPPGWEIQIGDLVNKSVDGKTICYSALKELRHYGYVTYKVTRDAETGQMESEYMVYEKPTDNPERENPSDVPLGKKHQGTDKRKSFVGGNKNPRSENLKDVATQDLIPDSDFLNMGKPDSEILNAAYSENLNTYNKIILRRNKKKEEPITFSDFWRIVLEALSKRVNPRSFGTWLKQTTCVSCDQTQCVIGIPDTLYEYWITEHYQGLIMDEIETLLGFRPQLRYTTL